MILRSWSLTSPKDANMARCSACSRCFRNVARELAEQRVRDAGDVGASSGKPGSGLGSVHPLLGWETKMYWIIHIYIYIYIYIYVYIYIFLYVYLYIYICRSVCICIIYIYIYIQYMNVFCLFIYILGCLSIHVFLMLYLFICIYLLSTKNVSIFSLNYILFILVIFSYILIEEKQRNYEHEPVLSIFRGPNFLYSPFGLFI